MSIFTKICGITNKEDLEAIIDLKPNAVGFIQWKDSLDMLNLRL